MVILRAEGTNGFAFWFMCGPAAPGPEVEDGVEGGEVTEPRLAVWIWGEAVGTGTAGVIVGVPGGCNDDGGWRGDIGIPGC